MAYVTNNKVSLGALYDYDDAIKEIASLVNVGARTDGKFYLSDICKGEKIKKWAKFKPVRYNSTGPLIESQFKEVNYGLKFPSFLWFNLFSATSANRILIYEQPRGGEVTPTEWCRIRDFNGYNHNASALNISLTMDAKIYEGQGFDGMLQVSNGTSQELTLADFKERYSTMSSTQPKVLSEFYVMLLFKIGTDYAILNTGKTTAEMGGLPLSFKVSSSDFNFKVGTEINVIACLAYDTTIPVGFNKVSQANGDFNTTLFIPLNTTTSLEAEESRVVVKYQFFSSVAITTGTVTPPVSGKNYYSFGNYFVIAVTDPWKLDNTFRLVFSLKRNGAPVGNYRTLEKAVTFSKGTGNTYVADLGAITINPITTTQTGDELWLDLQVQDSTSNFQSVYTKLMYTH